MVNKYTLYKFVLENPNYTAQLTQPEFDPLFVEEPQYSLSELYDKRVEDINAGILLFIKEYPELLTGTDALMLIQQKDDIIRFLKDKKESYIELLSLNDSSYTFFNCLQSILEVSIYTVRAYDDAEKLLTEDRTVYVAPLLKNGQRLKLMDSDGKLKNLQTHIANSTITIEKCRDLVKACHDHNCFPDELEIFLDVWTKTEGNECGDWPEEQLLDRTAKYSIEKDTLTIWENDKCVLENHSGILCTDKKELDLKYY
ncbi:protein of unknown function [Ruminococcaceae bacterium BL-6]|nr:protein of unknown function [Ruminococcaceae bacterium BL-6]